MSFAASLKMTAVNYKRIQAGQGICSLSANQIDQPISVFCIKKHLVDGVWIDKDTMLDKLSENQRNDFIKEKSKDYELFINPEIKAISEFQTKEWEECPSCPMYLE